MRLLFLPLIVLFLSAKAFAFGGAKAEFDASGRFLLAGDLAQEQRELLRKDFAYLQSLELRERDPELERVLELKGSGGAELRDWLALRARILVGDSFDSHDALVTLAEPQAYENPYQFPNIERYPKRSRSELDTISQSPRSLVVMKNVGASIYLLGKTEGRLIGVPIPGGALVPVSSPRVGILQVGKGHFFFALERFGALKSALDSEAYSVFRLGTLFHEARHSDGNGESLGFLHALCPPDHDYAHSHSCDRNLNGPYMVGGLVTRALLAHCKSCTAAEKEALRLEALDSFSRVIDATRDPLYVSADPKDHELCDGLREQNRILNDAAPLPELCYPPKPADGVIHSSYWDARPEGVSTQEPR